MPQLGILAALSFLMMMFNVPLIGGTTGHAVGGTLIAIIMGPYAACIAVSVALMIQALFFGDGGILAYGANCFNMAFLLPFVGYFVYKFIKDRVSGTKGEYIGAGVGSYFGINVAALCAGIEFGLQPLLFHSVAGQALYCPYSLSVSIPAMTIAHLTVAGPVEAAFSLLILAFVQKVAPDMVLSAARKSQSRSGACYRARMPQSIGLLASGTAWGEWGADEISSVASSGGTLGYVPAGMTSGINIRRCC